MTELILDNISLVLLLPLWLFLIIIIGRFFSVYVNKIIIYSLTLLSSLLGFSTCILALINIKNPADWIYPFISINNFTISFGLQIDRLSLIFASILFGISFAVQFFAISYMKEEKKNYRFFALLNLFNFSMAFLLFSPNLFQFYVFWELVGIVSYLLIGFDYKNTVKSDAAKRVFLVNRIGDTALISGILLSSYFMFAYSENSSFSGLFFEDLNPISILLSVNSSSVVYCIICGLFIFAAAVKSAQFPFHIWLQDAMEAEVPVSALLHSATMVAAGVYLIIKILPFLTLYPKLLLLITFIGIFTAIVCSFLASLENHPKKILAYSTSANLGLIFFAIGLGNIRAALVFLTAHAIIKSALFLLIPKENRQRSSGNVILTVLFSLSLAGVLFSGLCGKELIYHPLPADIIYKVLFLLTAFTTGFYITKFAILIITKSTTVKRINVTEFLPLLLLLAANILFYIPFRNLYTISEPYAAAIGGICLALLVAKHHYLEMSGIPKITEKICYNYFPAIYNSFANCCSKIEKNIFTNYRFLIYFSKTLVGIFGWLEEKVMNKSVILTKDFTKTISKLDKKWQKHNVQNYNLYAFCIIIIIFIIVIGYYAFLLT